jgi:hypothetical protein
MEEIVVEDTERPKMAAKDLNIQEEKLANQLRAELRAEFPSISEQQLEMIISVRIKTLLGTPVNVRKTLKLVDMGEDKDLSLNFKKNILR